MCLSTDFKSEPLNQTPHPTLCSAHNLQQVCFSLASKLETTGLPVKPSMALVFSRDLGALLTGFARASITRLEEEVSRSILARGVISTLPPTFNPLHASAEI